MLSALHSLRSLAGRSHSLASRSFPLLNLTRSFCSSTASSSPPHSSSSPSDPTSRALGFAYHSPRIVTQWSEADVWKWVSNVEPQLQQNPQLHINGKALLEKGLPVERLVSSNPEYEVSILYGIDLLKEHCARRDAAVLSYNLVRHSQFISGKENVFGDEFEERYKQKLRAAFVPLRERALQTKSGEEMLQVILDAKGVLQSLDERHPLALPTNFYMSKTRKGVLAEVSSWLHRALVMEHGACTNRSSLTLCGQKAVGKSTMLKLIAYVSALLFKQAAVVLIDASQVPVIRPADALLVVAEELIGKYLDGVERAVTRVLGNDLVPIVCVDEVHELVNKRLESHWSDLKKVAEQDGSLGILGGTHRQLEAYISNPRSFLTEEERRDVKYPGLIDLNGTKYRTRRLHRVNSREELVEFLAGFGVQPEACTDEYLQQLMWKSGGSYGFISALCRSKTLTLDFPHSEAPTIPTTNSPELWVIVHLYFHFLSTLASEIETKQGCANPEELWKYFDPFTPPSLSNDEVNVSIKAFNRRHDTAHTPEHIKDKLVDAGWLVESEMHHFQFSMPSLFERIDSNFSGTDDKLMLLDILNHATGDCANGAVILGKLIAGNHAVLVVGAGVSIATSGDPSAGWIKFLEKSVDKAPADDTWRSLQQGLLQSSDLLKVFENCKVKFGSTWKQWVSTTVGSLSPRNPKVIKELGAWRCPIITTNYDDLLEKVLKCKFMTWRDSALIDAMIRNHGSTSILHLHGIHTDPDTMIGAASDYDRICSSPHVDAIRNAYATTKSFVLVGCGAGATDPHFTRIWEFTKRVWPNKPEKHQFMLMTEDESKKKDPNLPVTKIVYGKNYAELPCFLSKVTTYASVFRKLPKQ